MIKFYKAKPEFELKITEAVRKHNIIGDVIIGWLREVVDKDVRTYIEFTNIPVFTDEHIKLKPELRKMIVKSSKSRRLNTRNKEANELIKHWKSYRDEHDIEDVIKNWSPFIDSEAFIIREAFPFGKVRRKRCIKENTVIFESDYESPNLELVTEISEKEYYELALSFVNKKQNGL